MAEADGSAHREMPATQGGPLRFGHGAPTDVTSLAFSPDGSMIAGAFTDYRTSGVFVLDIDASRIRKIVDVTPQMPYPFDWYASGTGNPRWIVQPFNGVRFAPDGRSVVYSTSHPERTAHVADDGVNVRHGFALFVQAIPDLSNDDGDHVERINLYVPEQRGATGQTTEAVLLPGTTTTWPAETSW